MKQSNKLWVVDLGAAYTKIIKSDLEEANVLNVEKVWIEKTPPNLRDGRLCEGKKDLMCFLRPFLIGHKKRDSLMLFVDRKEMEVVTCTFPMMEKTEVKAAIEWELRMLIREKFETWRIDYLAKERIDRYEYLGVDQKKLDVTGIAVEKEKLSAYVKVFKTIKHPLDSIVPVFHGLSILAEHTRTVSLIIDMGKISTRLYFFSEEALIAEKNIRLEDDWDGRTYLCEIIKRINELFQSPVIRSRGHGHEEILIIGGESLHGGVIDFLEKGLNRKVSPAIAVLEERIFIKFPEGLTQVEKCLLLPCLCGSLKWTQQ